MCIFFFQAEDGIRDYKVTGVQTCALPIWSGRTCPLPESARQSGPQDWPGAKSPDACCQQWLSYKGSFPPEMCDSKIFGSPRLNAVLGCRRVINDFTQGRAGITQRRGTAKPPPQERGHYCPPVPFTLPRGQECPRTCISCALLAACEQFRLCRCRGKAQLSAPVAVAPVLAPPSVSFN